MTTWSDEEILAYLHQQSVPKTEMTQTEIIIVDSIEEYMKQHKCIYAEDFLQKLHAKIHG